MHTADLNLLRVLDAVLTAGSVTGAAEKLHLSVPATSHALGRLRDLLGDPLLVRAGRRLVPTPRALQIREPLSQWMIQAQAMLARDAGRALTSVQRCFVVRAPEGIAIAFGAPLVLALRQTMPQATLRFVPETGDEDSALRDGDLDLDIGHFRPREPEMQTFELLRQRHVVLVRRGHPLAGQAVTARRYVQQEHVDVQRRPGSASPVDAALAASGLMRKVVLTVPQANVAALAAARSDLVATLSERMAQAVAASMDLELLPLAFAVEPEPMVLAWHPRHNVDPAHSLLREQVIKLIMAARST